MSARGGGTTRSDVAVAVLKLVSGLVMAAVILLLMWCLFDAADDGDTAHAVAYGSVLIMLALMEVRRK